MEPQQEHTDVHEEQPKSASPKKMPISTPAAILTGCVIIALAIVFVFGQKNAPSQQANNPENQIEEVKSVPKEVAKIRSDDYARGNPNADVVVIEYSDSDCPFCARFHPVMQQVVEDYDGKVAWVYRHFPLTQLHPNAYTEALALECVGMIAGDTAFNNYLDTVINVTLNPDPKSNQALIGYAEDEGVSRSAFQACIEGDEAAEQVEKLVNEAQEIGARGTPFNIVVNQKTGEQVIVPGAYPIDMMKQAIDSIL